MLNPEPAALSSVPAADRSQDPPVATPPPRSSVVTYELLGSLDDDAAPDFSCERDPPPTPEEGADAGGVKVKVEYVRMGRLLMRRTQRWE